MQSWKVISWIALAGVLIGIMLASPGAETSAGSAIQIASSHLPPSTDGEPQSSRWESSPLPGGELRLSDEVCKPIDCYRQCLRSGWCDGFCISPKECACQNPRFPGGQCQ